MAPLTAEDWLLIKTLQIKNGWTADKMIVEFPARQWVYYSLWDAFQHMVYCQKIKNGDHLKQVMNSCWDMVGQELINSATDQWSKWLLQHHSTIPYTDYPGSCPSVRTKLLVVILKMDIRSIVVNCAMFALVPNFVSVKTLPWKCRQYWCLWLVHLQLTCKKYLNAIFQLLCITCVTN